MKNLFLTIVTLLTLSIGFNSCKKDNTVNRFRVLSMSQAQILGSNDVNATSNWSIDSVYRNGSIINYQEDTTGLAGQTIVFTSDSIIWKNSSNFVTKRSGYLITDTILSLDNGQTNLILNIINSNQISLKDNIGSKTFYNRI